VPRKGVTQHFDDRLLGGAIDFGDEIVGRLALDGEQVELGRGAVDDGRGATGGLDGDVQGGMHSERSLLKKRATAAGTHRDRPASPRQNSENAEF